MLINHYFKSLIANGKRKTFGQLMEFTSHEVALFTNGFLKNKEISEEIGSDVYINKRNKRAQIGSIVNFGSCMFICLRNKNLLHLGKVKNDRVISNDTFSNICFNQLERVERFEL